MASTIEVEQMLELDLTPEALIKLGIHPLIAGDTVSWRFQVLDQYGVAVSLATVTAIRMSIRQYENDAASLVTRDLDVVIGASAVMQIVRDSQAAETVDANGEPTGTGWFQVNWIRLDETELLADLAGKSLVYDIRIRQAGNNPITFARGRIRILRAVTKESELP